MGGLTGYSPDPVETVQVYNPFTDSWTIGTPMPRPGDMSGPAVIVGDTIYISDAYDRHQGQNWSRMLKGAINPDTPTQIAWLWGPWLPEGMGGAKGTVSLHNKVYAFGLTYPESTVVMTGCVYDPATGGYTESLPGLLLEGIHSFYGEIVVAREAASEIYQVAGTWTSGGGSSRYNKLFVAPSGIHEAGTAVMPDKRLRVSTVFRNGARIYYGIDRSCWATLTVFDQSGRVVRTLMSAQVQAGSHAAAWDGRDQYGRPTGSGVYFCRLQAGGFTTARKMVKTE
jgi:hypothetical protein